MNPAPFNVTNAVWFQRERDKASDAALGDFRRRVSWHVRNKISGPLPVPRELLRGELVYDGRLDRIRRIADSDDETQIATVFHAQREMERRRFETAEAEFAEQCEAETGMAVSPEEWARQKSERSEIRRQSHVLAHMLESAGTVAYRSDAFQLWIWHVHSLTAEKIPNFRRICFLPYVAAMVRSSKLAALEFFLQHHPFCRFWTFTSGERVGIDGLGARVSELTARLNRLNKELIRLFGVEIVFRSTELGSVEFDAALRPQSDAGSIEFDENGEPLFHVHAHCVVHSRVGFIPPKKWEQMIAWVWSHWENHWDAGSIILNARECCKYVTKPGDMLKLTPAQLARVEAQLHGKRLVAPLGTLREEIAARAASGGCLRRKRTRDGMMWVEGKCQNKHLEQDLADQEAIFELHQAEVMDRYDAQVADWDHAGSVRKQTDAAICKVLARLAPAVGPRGLKEPRVIVGGNHLDRRFVMNHPLVSRLWASTVEAWEAGRAISVHTGTPTGEAEPMAFLDEVPERFQPPSPPVFAGQN